MPGSLVNLLDIHSDHSDISTKSTDPRIPGKKVSFNKAVRVKQYPWRPDEYQENDSNLSLSNQRFWFKVYKSNPSPHVNNDSTIWTDQLDDDTHDSLTPIAEDEDPSLEANLKELQFGYGYNGMMHEQAHAKKNCFSKVQPLDPPVDYLDDRLASTKNKYGFENGCDIPYIARARIKKHVTDSFDWNSRRSLEQPRSASVNGFSSPIRSPDICRPTISSAAKCSVDRMEAKNLATNTRLPRMGSKESTFSTGENSRFGTPNSSRDRRSRSCDQFDNRSSARVDKAVCTEDFPPELNDVAEILNKNRHWLVDKHSKDKATQCSGTLIRNKKICLNTLDGSRITKQPVLINSTTNPSHHVNSRTPLSTCLRLAETKSPLMSGVPKLVNEINQQSPYNNARDTKPLSLYGRNCISSNNRNGFNAGPDEKLTTPISLNSRYSNDRSKSYNLKAEKNEYDYVSDPFTKFSNKDIYTKEQQPGDANSVKIREECNGRHKTLPWKQTGDLKCNNGWRSRSQDSSPLAAVRQSKDTYSASTVGYVYGRRIPTEQVARQFAGPGAKKPPLRANSEYRKSSDIVSDTGTPRREMFSKTASSERSFGENRRSPFGCDDAQSMIDWSLSGFRFGSRSENNLSSSSDSECVVHRRAPLLMYIPGVSHHDRPAIEDDRLSAISGMSRSEAEEDPLSVRVHSEFKRRHSMPKNGKLNWLKWKPNKKALHES